MRRAVCLLSVPTLAQELQTTAAMSCDVKTQVEAHVQQLTSSTDRVQTPPPQPLSLRSSREAIFAFASLSSAGRRAVSAEPLFGMSSVVGSCSAGRQRVDVKSGQITTGIAQTRHSR